MVEIKDVNLDDIVLTDDEMKELEEADKGEGVGVDE